MNKGDKFLQKMPFVRAIGGIVGCVWVYMQKVELRHWWEYVDEKTGIN